MPGTDGCHRVAVSRPPLRSPHDREIARLAVPAFGTLVAEPLYVLADTAVVGRLGTTELAGLAVASTVLLTAHSLLIFLAYGTTATVSRLIGAERHRQAAEVGVGALWLALVLGVASALVLAATATPVLRALGADGEVLTAGLLYLRVSLVGFPFLLLMLAGAGTFHGHQDTRTPLLLAVGSALANLAIEVVLVFGFDRGWAPRPWRPSWPRPGRAGPTCSRWGGGPGGGGPVSGRTGW